MKQATLTRDDSTDEGTFGMLVANDGSLALHSLELPWRDLNGDDLGDPQRSCITPGVYVLRWHYSPHRGWCYEVTNVQGRSHILVHPANFAGDVDKGWVSELLGCIALGYALGRLQPDLAKWPGAQPQRALTRDAQGRGSRAACNAFFVWGEQKPVELMIR